jgi:hypothetical protein
LAGDDKVAALALGVASMGGTPAATEANEASG